MKIRLTCKLCNYKAKHNITAGEYRDRFGQDLLMQLNFNKRDLRYKDPKLIKKTKQSRASEIEAKKGKNLISKTQVRNLLTEDDFYKTLLGKSKGRTLFKLNPDLFTSIYYHTRLLEKETKKSRGYKANYSFTSRLKFIVDYNYDIEKVKCKCKKRITFNKYCRECNEDTTHEGFKHTEESRAKMRLKAIELIEKQKGQLAPRYNTDSVKLIERYGKENGYNFQHAESKGEYRVEKLGYWLDAYDYKKKIQYSRFTRNIILEKEN